MPAIAITIGDPSGIGPEVVCRALLQMSAEEQQKICVIGHKDILDRANHLVNGKLQFSSQDNKDTISLIDVETPKKSMISDGQATEGGGHAAYGFVVQGVKSAMAGKVDAVVTAPLNKTALHMAGHKFDGHTGLLQHLTKAPSSFMLLSSRQIVTILVSTHVSLLDAVKNCKQEKIVEAIHAGNIHLRQLGVAQPRIAVAGINPHSGEGGLFGHEEIEQIRPAVVQARLEGIQVSGPYPADTIFHRAVEGEFDLVVAQYHDQALIPVKLLDFGNAVNVTLGLPIRRTSVDHGTAFDIAWKGVADPASMVAAISYARKLAIL